MSRRPVHQAKRNGYAAEQHYLAAIGHAARHLRWQGNAWQLLGSFALIAQLVSAAWLLGWLAQSPVPGEEILSGWTVFVVGGCALLIRLLAQERSDAVHTSASLKTIQKARERLFNAWQVRCERSARALSAKSAQVALEPVDALLNYFTRYLPLRTAMFVVPFVIFVIVLLHDWVAAIFLALAAPLIPIFMALVGMGAERLNTRYMERLQHLSALFIDRLRNLSLIFLLRKEQAATRQIAQASDAFRQTQMKTLRVAFLSSAVLEFFAAVAIAALAIYIGFALLGYLTWGPAPDLSLFSGILILMLAPEFFQPLRQFAHAYHDRAAALGGASLLLAEEHAPAQSASSQRDDAAGSSSRAITPPNGSFVLLEGPSGSGKTTWLHQFALNSQVPIALQRQTPWIVSGTVADNLRLYQPSASEHEIDTMLQNVGLDGFAHIEVSEQGRNISGGEAKRIAIARCLLAPMSYTIVLDEPFAALDTQSAERVLQLIQQRMSKGQTFVIAAHKTGIADLHGLATERITFAGSGPIGHEVEMHFTEDAHGHDAV